MRYLSISKGPKWLINLLSIYPDSTQEAGKCYYSPWWGRGAERDMLTFRNSLLPAFGVVTPQRSSTNSHEVSHQLHQVNYSSSENSTSQTVQRVQTSPWFYLDLNCGLGFAVQIFCLQSSHLSIMGHMGTYITIITLNILETENL